MMRLSPKTVLPLLLVAAIILAGAAALARTGRAAEPPSVAGIGDPGAAASPPSTMAATGMEPGNYCVSCHSAADSRLQSDLTAWRGGIEAAGVSPCPAVKKVQEELFYTERLLLAIDRYQASLPGYVSTASLDSKLAAGQQGYLRLLDTPVTSLDAFVAEAQSVRFTLGKVYAGLQALDEAAKRTLSLTVAFGVSLILLGSLAWGLYNTRHVKGQASHPGLGSLAKTAVFLLLILAFFSLPLLRVPQVDAASTAEALEVQTELDTVQRAGDAANRAYARAWALSQVSVHWQVLDPDQSDKTLEMALQAAEEANTEAAALWGEAAAAQEAAVSDPAKLESAGLIAGEVQAVRSRAWNYRLMAEDWRDNDPEQAAALLEQAILALPATSNVYTDLDRRSIALALSLSIDDPERAENILRQVQDPAIRSWGMINAAHLNLDWPPRGQTEELTRLAVEAAREVKDPIRRGTTLGKIAGRLNDPGLAAQALAAINEAPAELQPYGIAELVKFMEMPDVTAQITAFDQLDLPAQISTGYPEAAALTWLRLRNYAEAWNASLNIADPYERDRAQSEIVTIWVRADASQAAKAAEIEIPLLRDRTMRNVIQFTGDASLVEQIVNPYDRVLALTSIGRYDEAEALAGELKDTRPLVELALAVVEDDPQRALAMVDKLSREADKAAVLTAVTAQTGDAELFERALAMAAAARVRGDALAPAQATLDLALRFFDLDPALAERAMQQALDLAERISIK